MDEIIFSEGFRALVLIGLPITLAGVFGGVLSIVLAKLVGASDEGLQYVLRAVFITGVIVALGLGFLEQFKSLFEMTIQ
jgi:hypothetical protein